MRHTPLTRDTAAYMRTPSPLYDHLFKGKKMAGMAGEIRQLWLAPRSHASVRIDGHGGGGGLRQARFKDCIREGTAKVKVGRWLCLGLTSLGIA